MYQKEEALLLQLQTTGEFSGALQPRAPRLFTEVQKIPLLRGLQRVQRLGQVEEPADGKIWTTEAQKRTSSGSDPKTA